MSSSGFSDVFQWSLSGGTCIHHRHRSALNILQFCWYSWSLFRFCCKRAHTASGLGIGSGGAFLRDRGFMLHRLFIAVLYLVCVSCPVKVEVVSHQLDQTEDGAASGYRSK